MVWKYEVGQVLTITASAKVFPPIGKDGIRSPHLQPLALTVIARCFNEWRDGTERYYLCRQSYVGAIHIAESELGNFYEVELMPYPEPPCKEEA